ncbi:MAG TPA: gliding motility-associated C-terminal domain-containing protein [Bacteroidales bacterium]|nr:gliding motility-associated C-terminal domain-containing protein [Bacteroidales bacterium]HPL03818.1 gliding motility-associated C-terminal domain-containing protein [Bacteroidales bacterium]
MTSSVTVQTNQICSTPGSATVLGSGGTSPYTYSWPANAGGVSGNTASSLLAGTYDVTVRDANSCSKVQPVIIIDEGDIAATASVNTNVSCYGGNDGSINIVITDGSPAYTINWGSGNATTSSNNYTITGLVADTYIISVTDINSCQTILTATITEPALLQASSSATAILCNGDNSTVTVSASGGTAPYTGTGNFTRPAGTYSFTVTDAKGCTAATIISISQPTQLVASSTYTPILCYGGSSTVTVSASGGTGAYTGTGTYTVSAGTHSYTVTDANGCTSITSVTISQPSLLVANSTGDNVLCYGGTATVNVTASGGTGTYSGTGIMTNVSAGTYSFTVTDANNCSAITSITITEPPLLQASSSATAILCNGGTSTVTISATGGTAPYTGTGNFTRPSGTYSFTVTDAKGCTAETSITITQPTQLITSSTFTPILCNGGTSTVTVTATGGTGIYSGTGTYIENAGTYSYTVTDANGCTSETSVTISQPNLLVASSIANEILCYGGTTTVIVTASGGMLPYSGTGAMTNISAGTHSFTVTDANNCSAVTNITITEPPLLQASSSATAILCNGGTSTVTVSATGGTSPYTGTGNFTLPVGTYSYTITDAKGCTAETSITITQPTQLVASSTFTPILCNGETSTVTVSATGGTGTYSGIGEYVVHAGNYSYTVTDANGCTAVTNGTISQPNLLVASSTANNVLCNGGTTSVNVIASGGTVPYSGAGVITNISAGVHSFTVTDANGCSAVTNITITEPPLLQASSSATAILCNGETSTVTVSATGGTGAYTGIGNFTRPAGTYSYIVADANNCTATTNITISEPPLLVANANANDILCYGGTTTVNVTASGGTIPYSGTGAINNVSSGTYSYIVTDANGCLATTNITITQPSQLMLKAVVDKNVSCNGLADGQATATATGGTEPYVFNWNNPSSSYGSTTNQLPAGTWTVKVTDNNSCMAQKSVTIVEPDVLLVNVNTSDVLCYGASTGSANAVVAGGTYPYYYSWSAGGQTTSAITNLSAGVYVLTVKDANDCQAVASAVINQSPELNISLESIPATCGSYGGSIVATVVGGSPDYQYMWSTGNVQNNIQNLVPGNYSLTVRDAYMCTKAQSIDVGIYGSINAEINELNSIKCFGNQEGALQAISSNGKYPLNFEWNTGATNSTITNIGRGYYNVIITDAWGCVGNANYVLVEPTQIVTYTDIQKVSCFGLSDGGISTQVVGGTPPYTYMWSNAETSTSISNLAIGSYSLTIYDSFGCQEIETYEITQPDKLKIDLVVKDILCYGNNDGGIKITATGGTQPYSYELAIEDSVLTGQLHSPLGTGSYVAYVRDVNSCLDTVLAVITSPAPLEASYIFEGPSCNGARDGYIEITVSGGVEPYLYSNNYFTVDIALLSGLGAGNFNVTVSDANDCRIEFEEIFLAESEIDCLKIPDAFTPNGDGINDTWIIENIKMFPGARIYVFNRWGQEVWMGYPDEEWDGKYYNNSKPMPAGTYLYVIELYNGTKPYTGTVSLIY